MTYDMSVPQTQPGASARRGVAAEFARRLLTAEARANRIASNQTSQRLLLAVAFAVFVTVTLVSFVALPETADFRWSVLPLLLFVVNPIMLTVNAGEYRAIARLVGHDVPWRSAVRLTVLASAANLLPLPGAVMVRTQALRHRGTTYRSAFSANATAGLVWIGCGAITIAVLIAGRGENLVISVATVATGLGALAASVMLGHRISAGQFLGSFTRLLVIEAMTVLISATRIYLAFQLMGLSVSPAEAVALSASVIIAAAIGIFPAGLGLREAIAGAIGALLQTRAAAAAAATAMDRVAGLVTNALVSVLIITRPNWHRPASTSTSSEGNSA